ncbi:hypothetical protein IEQ34_020218 [Dendrobium chrysotoxum]|uniref:RNase H type-1 domain-containing protein n=1 Tax=Dendrobium chrysotoxum TaxID=161865 RepID=A0AAV7G0C6_DENCH|nr:hypothetical protein IEQ34_020218 [Dendrobium chrysotoxum]
MLRLRSRIGVGGVIRDFKGRFLFAFGFKCLHWDSSELEVQAVLSLRMVLQEWMYECKGLIIKGDNLNVIKYIQSMLKKDVATVDSLNKDDFFFLEDFNQVIIQFVYRDCNKLADYCANYARFFYFIWDSIGSNKILLISYLC